MSLLRRKAPRVTVPDVIPDAIAERAWLDGFGEIQRIAVAACEDNPNDQHVHNCARAVASAQTAEVALMIARNWQRREPRNRALADLALDVHNRLRGLR